VLVPASIHANECNSDSKKRETLPRLPQTRGGIVFVDKEGRLNLKKDWTSSGLPSPGGEIWCSTKRVIGCVKEGDTIKAPVL